MSKLTSLETQILNELTIGWPRDASMMLYPMMGANGNHTVNVIISKEDLLETIRKKAKLALK